MKEYVVTVGARGAGRKAFKKRVRKMKMKRFVKETLCFWILLILCIVAMIVGLFTSFRADAVDLEEPEKVGMLVIPAVLREQKREPVTLTPKIDNERKLSMRQARQERKNASCVTEESEETQEPERVYLGRYMVTGYDPFCAHCCGKNDGITSSGIKAIIGETVAMYGIEFGTRIYIDGLGEYTVHDRGVGPGKVDVACDGHSECFAVTGWYDVYVVEAVE